MEISVLLLLLLLWLGDMYNCAMLELVEALVILPPAFLVRGEERIIWVCVAHVDFVNTRYCKYVKLWGSAFFMSLFFAFPTYFFSRGVYVYLFVWLSPRYLLMPLKLPRPLRTSLSLSLFLSLPLTIYAYCHIDQPGRFVHLLLLLFPCLFFFLLLLIAA